MSLINVKHISATSIRKGIEPDEMAEMYKKVHPAISADPIMKNLPRSTSGTT